MASVAYLEAAPGGTMRPHTAPYVLVFTFPLLWVLGISAFAWPFLVLPLLIALASQRWIATPRRFGVWLLFLVLMVVSAVRLETPGSSLVFLYRASIYVSATVLFLYVFNAPYRLLPTQTVVRALALAWSMVALGGLAGVLFPGAEWTSIVERAAPNLVAQYTWVRELVHPALTDTSTFQGASSSRPTFLFAYTNEWGSAFALLLPFAIAAAARARGALRLLLVSALAAAIVPAVTSLNRGLWLSIAVGAVYVTFHYVRRHRVDIVGRVGLALSLMAAALVVTSLGAQVRNNLVRPQSDESRHQLYTESWKRVQDSPVIGFGTVQRSESQYLPRVGTHGQLLMVVVSHGIPAAICFFGWFFLSFRRTRRGDELGPFAARVALLLFLVQSLFYDLVPAQLMVAMVAAALVLRPEIHGDEQGTAGGATGGSVAAAAV
jgi:polysaccharide biosynthesis protein PslJ